LQILTEFANRAHHISVIVAAQGTNELSLNEGGPDLIGVHASPHSLFDVQFGYQARKS